MTKPGEAALRPRRVIEGLRELHALTGDAHGAQRVAFTPLWAAARDWFLDGLHELPVTCEKDAAGNVWVTLPGRSEEALVLGSHLDSVPDGGWLDGCLGVLAGLEVLRRLSAQGVPPVTVRLVDWADEEGARFGRSLFGSSAVAGTLDVPSVGDLRDRQGLTLRDVVSGYGVDLDMIDTARAGLRSARAYLELHIEQGPVLEDLRVPLGVVLGTVGIERHAVRLEGQTAHAGSTPMPRRRDAFCAAARLALAARAVAVRHEGVATAGSCTTSPGIPTAVPGCCEMTLDLRHLDAPTLALMLDEAVGESERIGAEEQVTMAWRQLWRIDPVVFHPGLIELASDAATELAGEAPRLPSGPLHDAAEVARAGIPTVMLFVQSLKGLSHTAREDTREEHLELAVLALDRLTDKVIDWIRNG